MRKYFQSKAANKLVLKSTGGSIMRPSNYNYLKRMWTREYANRGCCLTTIIFFPFILVSYIFIFIVKVILFFIPDNNQKNNYKKPTEDSQRSQMLRACSYNADTLQNDVFSSEEYQAFIILSEHNASISAIQRFMKIGFNHTLRILERLEELKAIEIKENNQIELLVTKEELIEKLK